MGSPDWMMGCSKSVSLQCRRSFRNNAEVVKDYGSNWSRKLELWADCFTAWKYNWLCWWYASPSYRWGVDPCLNIENKIQSRSRRISKRPHAGRNVNNRRLWKQEIECDCILECSHDICWLDHFWLWWRSRSWTIQITRIGSWLSRNTNCIMGSVIMS